MKLVDIPGLRTRFGLTLSKASIYRRMKAKDFPKPIRLGATTRLYFLESDIEAWLEAKAADRSKAA